MPRRFIRRPALQTLIFVAAAIGLLVWMVARSSLRVPEGEREVTAAFGGQTQVLLRPGKCQIVRVIDPATLVVRQQDFEGGTDVSRLFRVRLLGVRTPSAADRMTENVDAAILRLKDLAAASSEAVIELDKRRIAADGSWLAYVYCGEKLLNAEVIRIGALQYDNYPGDNAPIARRLGQSQDEARRTKRGVWSE